MKFYNVFSGPLIGRTREAYMRNIEDRVFNSLYSYYYLKDFNDSIIEDSFKMNKGNIMIDSGAFTAWSKDIELDVDNYLNWINKWDKYITLFGQIDVIPDKEATRAEIDECCKKTWNNYLYMTKKMKNPKKLLYTFHFGEDYKWLRKALEYKDKNGKPMEYMALGGLVGKSTKKREIFLKQCFDIIKTSSNPNIKVHGFGVSSEKLWREFPFESADSSSPNICTNNGAEKKSPILTEGFERIFKPRGWTTGCKILELKKDKEEENYLKTEKRIKLLIENIEKFNNLADEISKDKSNLVNFENNNSI